MSLCLVEPGCATGVHRANYLKFKRYSTVTCKIIVCLRVALSFFNIYFKQGTLKERRALQITRKYLFTS